jgi:hypothetical protein
MDWFRSAEVHMSISKKQRFEVFKRDNFTCQYCGRGTPDVVLHVDHVHPKSRGGTDDPVNLLTACADCNHGKGARKLDAPSHNQIQNAEDRAARLEQLQALNDMLAEQRAATEALVDGLERAWYAAVVNNTRSDRMEGVTAEFFCWTPGERRAVRRWLEQMPHFAVEEGMDIALRKFQPFFGAPVERSGDGLPESWRYRNGNEAFRYFMGICRNKHLEKAWLR